MSNSLSKVRGVGVNPTSQLHYADHLAVICQLMGFPLLFLEENDFELAKKYYPSLSTLLVPYEEMTLEYLISNYDMLVLSDLWDRQSFHEKFHLLEMKYGKTLRHVHVPHGFSDKGFYLRKTANEDIALIYGQNMFDMLSHFGTLQNLHYPVRSGNYRYTYFKENRPFYEEIVKEEILGRFLKEQPIILYAPTWKDSEESTTFFDSAAPLLDGLPHEYNMVVKLHPRLEQDDPVLYYQILGRYEKKPNVLFLKDFPLVYPLLAHSDLYIGDMSSVGYDFLPFNRPMFFITKGVSPTGRGRTDLYSCGWEVPQEKAAQIYKIIEKSVPLDQEKFGQARKEMDLYTFGEERKFSEIKEDILKAYRAPYQE